MNTELLSAMKRPDMTFAQIAEAMKELPESSPGKCRLLDLASLFYGQPISKLVQRQFDPHNVYGDEYWEGLCDEELAPPVTKTSHGEAVHSPADRLSCSTRNGTRKGARSHNYPSR